MFDLKTYLERVRGQVNAALLSVLRDPTADTRISRAMTHAVMAGGKRLRPVLCIAAAESVGGSRRRVVPLACALELIHTYSLIHDDLPAMDDDDKRRGKPTCHVQFDEATAILAGDALLTLAFEVLSATAAQGDPANHHRWLSAMARIASAAGHKGMIEGQMRDMAFEGVSISQVELEALHRLKTGKMIEVAVACGAIVSGASETQRRALQTYAQHIGLAFQVADDILNVKGNPERMGKATGTDQMRGKNTYPSLLGLPASESFAVQLTNNALKALETFDNKADPLRAVARYVIQRNR